MKKFFMILVVFLSISTLCGCEDQQVKTIEFKDDHGYDTNNNVTYRFTGVSDHFAFETGKVYYGEDNQLYLLIKNFKIIKKLDKQENIDKYSLNLYFNDKSMFSGEMKELGNKDFNDEINNILIEESAVKREDGYGESDAFIETSKSTFKKAIKMEMEYCYKNDKCETENFEFNYFE